MKKAPQGTWTVRILSYLATGHNGGDATGACMKRYMEEHYPGQAGVKSATLRSAVINLCSQGFIKREGRGFAESRFTITEEGRQRWAAIQEKV